MQVRVANARNAQGKGSRKGVWVDRRSPLGNPFTEDARIAERRDDCTLVDSVAEAVRLYEPWLIDQLAGESPASVIRASEAVEMFEALVKLARRPEGVTLICWCDPAPCHAHVLARYIELFVPEALAPTPPVKRQRKPRVRRTAA